jgi:hypothetical protein
METKMNGGPAFHTYHGGYTKCDTEGGGMTLRDYFAANAMQAIICQKDANEGGLESVSIAWISYQMADAMLKAREA